MLLIALFVLTLVVVLAYVLTPNQAQHANDVAPSGGGSSARDTVPEQHRVVSTALQRSNARPEESDERRLGPTLYEGPAFDLDLVYGTPAFDTKDSTTSFGMRISTSVSAGSTTTSRRVTVARIHGRTALDPTYLVGFCHVRQDTRHFRVDRIRELKPSGATTAEPNPSWYLRRVVARGRGERPLLRSDESLVLGTELNKPVVIHWRRQRFVDEAGKVIQPEWDGGHIRTGLGRWDTRVEVYDVEIDSISQHGDSMRIVGKSKRRPTGGARRWSGDKTFYLHDCEAFETTDGVPIPDPREFLYEAAGLAVEDRPMLLGSAPKPAEPVITAVVRPDLKPSGTGTAQVNQRDRKLRKREGSIFYLGREEFEDATESPSGRFVAGVSDGNLETVDVVPGVALVDLENGVAAYVVRFRARPRWPRVSDSGLLLLREVSGDRAILHVFDSQGQRRWGVALPTTHDLAEFSADGSLVAIISGLFWRKSDADVWTWLLRSDTGAVIESLSGAGVLRSTKDGRCEIRGQSGPVTVLSPPGMLERVLAPEYAAEWRTSPR